MFFEKKLLFNFRCFTIISSTTEKPLKLKSKFFFRKTFSTKNRPPYQKDHKSRLKSQYLVMTPPPPFGGYGGSKRGQNRFFGNFEANLPVPTSYQPKMNAKFGFSMKKSSKIPSFIKDRQKRPFFVGLCNLLQKKLFMCQNFLFAANQF